MNNKNTFYFDIFLNWGCAGLANASTSSLLHPMDLVKTQMQIISTKDNPINPFRIFVSIYQQHGLIGLYRPGLTASIAREFLNSGPRAGLYVPLRNFLNNITQNKNDMRESFSSKLLAAVTTGTIGALIANPIDVIKIRLMANNNSYNSISSSFQSIRKEEGIRGFYKGLFPSTLRGAFISVGELATYDITKDLLHQYIITKKEEGPFLHIIASLITGLVATTIAAPFDLLKTRSMNSKNVEENIATMTIRVVRKEGILVLFRGWLPAYCRLGPHALICFPIYEQLRHLCGLDYL